LFTPFRHSPAQRLGKRAPKIDLRTLRLRDYLKPKVVAPQPPPEVSWIMEVNDWGMLGNDSLGDCLVPGTEIFAPNISAAMRAPYSGPVVTLVFQSGKCVTVTPNHAVLTPRGFIPACFLKKGDHAVSSGLPQEVSRGLQSDFNDPPTLVEEKLASLAVMPQSFSRKVVPLPVDFDGDARFMYGNVDIVRPHRFLEGERNVTLSEPDGHQQIGATGKLKRSLHGFGPSRQGFGVSRLSAFGAMCRLDYLQPLLRSHATVAQPEALGLRPNGHTGVPKQSNHSFLAESRNSVPFPNLVDGQPAVVVGNRVRQIRERVFAAPKRGVRRRLASGLNASLAKPSNKGVATDPGLYSQLHGRFPNLIATERVAEVYVNSFTGHVYDLSTDQRWYIANTIITHNCVEAAQLHVIQQWTHYAGTELVPTTNDAIRLYSAEGGYVPGQPNTDNGTVILDALNYWRKTGVAVGTALHKITAYVAVDWKNQDELQSAIQWFGNVILGVQLPVSAQTQTAWTVPNGGPYGQGSPGSWGGHCVPVLARSPETASCITWGQRLKMSHNFFTDYVDECYAVVSQDWIEANGEAPSGLNLTQLQADLAEVTK
jgi:hypothetical protein